MITTADCIYKRDTKRLFLNSDLLGGKFPREIEIASVKSGEIVKFTVIGEDHPMFSQIVGMAKCAFTSLYARWKRFPFLLYNIHTEVI